MTRLLARRARPLLTRLLGILAALALAAPAAVGVSAQDEAPVVTITAVDSNAFPTVSADLTVTGANGLPLVGLSAANFTILEDGQAVPAGRVTLDGDTSQPLTLVLAIDLAMPAAELVTVQAALRNFTDSLTPQDQVALLSFANEVVEVQDFTNDRLALATAVGGLAPSGNATLFNQAAQTAVAMLGRLPVGRKAVLLFTDSGDTANTLSPEPTINAANAAGVALYPFGSSPRVNETVLDNWARFTGGQAYPLASPAEIQANLQTLGVLLRQSYRLTYTSGVAADNARHNLVVELDYQNQLVSADSRFTAVPGEVRIEGLTVANGQTLRGMVFLIADVAAPAPVESVTFQLDGETLVELTSPPYRFDWDTATAGAGTHAVTVVARDSAGNEGELQVSVNVAVPAPVAPTAAPVPTAVPSASPLVGLARNALNLGRLVLIAAALLAGFIIALLLWLRARELQAPEPIDSARLELTNRGNARARFELRAEDPAKLMKFQFLVNEANLATRKAPVTYSPAGAAQMAPAAGLAAPAATNGKAKREQNEAKRRGVRKPEAVTKAQGVAFKGVGMAARFSGWMAAVSYLLPGRQSLKLRGQTAQFRSNIDVVDDAAKLPDSYRHIIDDAVPVDAIRDKMGRGEKPAKNQAAAQPMSAVATAPGMAAPTMVGTAPGYAPATTVAAAPQAPVLQKISANTAGWAVTPFLEPGSTLTIRLQITPLRVPKSQSYGFRVLSRVAESADPNKLTQIEHGSVALESKPWYRQLVPWLLFVVMLGALALLMWYLLSVFGVI